MYPSAASCPQCGRRINPLSKVITSQGGLWFCDTKCKANYYHLDIKQKPLPWSERISMVVVVAVIVGLVIFLFSLPAHSAYGGPPSIYSAWFQDQKQEPRLVWRRTPGDDHMEQVVAEPPCCGGPENEGGDGRYVDARSIGNGQYEVWIAEVHNWVLFDKPYQYHFNPTGRSVVWLKIYYNPEGEVGITFYCLRLAEGA